MVFPENCFLISAEHEEGFLPYLAYCLRNQRFDFYFHFGQILIRFVRKLDFVIFTELLLQQKIVLNGIWKLERHQNCQLDAIIRGASSIKLRTFDKPSVDNFWFCLVRNIYKNHFCVGRTASRSR